MDFNMKLIGIDIDNNLKSIDFFNQAEKILDVEILRLPIEKIQKNVDVTYMYENFSMAGFALESLLMNNNEYFHNENKPAINALFCFNNYSIDKLEQIRPYRDVFVKDLMIFQHIEYSNKPDWLFGNIIAVTKWSSSLFKLKDNMFQNLGRYGLKHNHNMDKAIWYATRIGMDVRGI